MSRVWNPDDPDRRIVSVCLSAMKQDYRYLFGPVPSRRFGRSLGIDLTPFKTCSLDCIFCQLGRTTRLTCEQEEFVSTQAVLRELAHWFAAGNTADFLTLSGSGEPTLHSGFGAIIRYLRQQTEIPVALLSNGTLFTRPSVREAALQANVVKLSLSGGDQETFRQINRPHPGLQIESMVEGYRAFRKAFRGRLVLEVFLVRGMNDTPEAVARIAALANTVEADDVHLNTAVRPPAESYALPLTRAEMEALTERFRPAATVIAEFSADRSSGVAANESTILAMLRRRPCTARQVAEVFGMHLNEVSKYIGKLSRTGRIVPLAREGEGEPFFAAADAANEPVAPRERTSEQ
jgi:wyosine [tRNA(Phe)-imidazoG37] synthetase (radical SAM superfamily)